MAGQAVDEADVDIPVLIGLDPGLRLHVVLADHRARFHRGVDLVAGAVQETRIDEDDALGRLLDAGLEVHRGAALLVHDPDLQRVVRQAQELLDPAEQLDRQRHLVRAVHLRLDDVDRAGAAVLELRMALEIVNREQAGHRGIQDAFRDLLAVSVEHRIGEHVMADIAHQQEAAAVQGQPLAVGGLVDAIGMQRAGQRLAALLEIGRQRAVHQPERVAVDQDLVLGIDGCDRVLHVEDGRDRGFHDHVGNPGRIVLADQVAAVDRELDMQAVVDQQDCGRRRRIALEAGKLRGILQRGGVAALQLDRELAGNDRIGGDVGVAAGGERHGGIEEGLGLGDHLVAARLVVAFSAFARIVRNSVGAVEGVIERAPARIRGVQRVARIGEGHDELRAADLADFLVDA